MESHKGTIIDTIFRNNDNGYTVALMETENEVMTVTGVFGTDVTNETLEIFGDRVKHPKYGEQFTVEMYNSVLPSSLIQIENYFIVWFD